MISPDRKRMLVISDQDMLRAGNQLLFRAIEGYIRGGFDVVFLTHEKQETNLADLNDLFGDLMRHLKVVRVSMASSLLRIAGKAKSILFDSKTNEECVVSEPARDFPPAPDIIVDFLPAASNNGAANRIYRSYFNQRLRSAAMALHKRHPFDILCGYEVMATPVAQQVAHTLGLPLFNRFQGTFLKKPLQDGTAKKLYPYHLKGTQIPADLYVMENDGTGGMEVLLKLGHPKDRILFMLDGIRKDIYQPHLTKSEVYEPYSIPINKETRIILTLSKLSQWKRHDRIIGAMPQILKALPDTWLVIAHRGPLRDQLEEYAKRIGIGHRVVFSGPVPHQDVYRFLNTCDVYVNCNDWSNLSNTVLEALECGRPVVSMNDGSLDGIVTDGVNGFLVDLREIRAKLPPRILHILDNQELRGTLSSNARSFADKNLLSWNRRMEIEVSRVSELLA